MRSPQIALILMTFLSSSDNLFQDNYIIFPKRIDNITTKHTEFRFEMSFPLNTLTYIWMSKTQNIDD